MYKKYALPQSTHICGKKELLKCLFTNCQSSTFLRFLIDWLPNYLIVANLDFAWALKYLVHVSGLFLLKEILTKMNLM